MRSVLEEATWRNSRADAVGQEREWKIFVLLPRMLLRRPPVGGLVPKEKLVARFQMFARGERLSLLRASTICDEKAARSRNRRRRSAGDEIARLVIKAKHLFELGKLSTAGVGGCCSGFRRSNIIGLVAGCAPPPQEPREPLTPDMMRFQPEMKFHLDESMFGKNLRSTRKGVAGGVSGVTTEYLRPLLDDHRAMHLFPDWVRTWREPRCQKLLSPL